MKSLTLAVLAVTLTTAIFAGIAFAQTPDRNASISASSARFNLGFKALAGQIPGVVGTPLEDEHWGANGDSLQQTSTGLMVWRKADNWTAFTNGSRTWINGPQGVQDRANDDRFAWEGPSASTRSDGSEITLYDRRGKAAAYIATNDENTIYLWTGEPVAYLLGEHVYGFNGQHIGWFQEGIIWDYEGTSVGFTPETQGGDHSGDPVKSSRQARPAKLPTEPAPPQPLTTKDVYTTLLTGVLQRGQVR